MADTQDLMTAEELLTQLTPDSDLARLVRRISQDHLTWVIVPNSGIVAWELQDPAGWARVSEWLVLHDVSVVRV